MLQIVTIYMYSVVFDNVIFIEVGQRQAFVIPIFDFAMLDTSAQEMYCQNIHFMCSTNVNYNLPLTLRQCLTCEILKPLRASLLLFAIIHSIN